LPVIVHHALQPIPVNALLPEIVLCEDGKPLGLTITITVENLHPDAEFILCHPDNTISPLDVPEADKEGYVNIFIDTTDLIPGEYDIIIRNPGGLEAVLRGLIVIEEPSEIESVIEETPVLLPEIEEEFEIETDLDDFIFSAYFD
jgi:hypothetical protein